MCVLDYGTMYTVVRSTAGSLGGKTVDTLTTGAPKQAREAETWFKQRGAPCCFDGGITEHAIIVSSGESEESQRWRRTCSAAWTRQAGRGTAMAGKYLLSRYSRRAVNTALANEAVFGNSTHVDLTVGRTGPRAKATHG